MASTSLMDVVLDSVADGVFTVDPDLHITYWNRAAEEITGYPAGEALGRQCHEVFRASLCLEECPMRQAVATGKTPAPADVEIPIKTDRDAFVFVEVEGRPDALYAATLPGFTPLAFANPIYIDADANGAWTPPGLGAVEGLPAAAGTAE